MLLWRWATKCTPLEATAPGRTTRHSVRLTCMSLTQVCKETVLHQRLRWSELRQGKLDVKCLVGIGRVKLISINTLRCYHQEERGGCMSKKCLQVCSTVALYRWQLKPQAFRCGFLNTLSWLYRSFFFFQFSTQTFFFTCYGNFTTFSCGWCVPAVVVTWKDLLKQKTLIEILLADWNGKEAALSIVNVAILVTCFVLPLFDVCFTTVPAVS